MRQPALHVPYTQKELDDSVIVYTITIELMAGADSAFASLLEGVASEEDLESTERWVSYLTGNFPQLAV